MPEKKTIKLLNDDGIEVECEVLFTFNSDETGKDYVVYTDNTEDINGDVKVYASTYDPKEEPWRLKAIEDEKEWEIVGKVLDEVARKVQDE